jgi:PAS domain S-box-containing protein
MERVDRIVRLAARALRASRAVFSHSPVFECDDAVAWLCAPVCAKDGESLGTLSVVDDVPRSWTADDVATLNDLAADIAIEYARAQLDDYLEYTTVLVQVASPDGRLLFVNRAWRQALGYDPTTICAADVVATDERGVYVQAVQQVLSGREVPPFEIVFVTTSGARLVVRAVLRARFEDGVPVSVRGTFEDVTATMQIDEAQTRLVEVLEATSDFVGIADMSGQAVYINRAGRALIGMGARESLSPVSMRTVYTRAGRQQLLRTAIPAAMRGRTWQGESWIRARDGRTIPVSQVVVAHMSASGVWYFSTIMRDVSEARLLQRLAFDVGDADDADAGFLVALDLFCQVTGWPYAEVWLPDEAKSMLTRGPVRGQPPEKAVPRVGIPVMADDEVVAVLVFAMPDGDAGDESKQRLVAHLAGQLGDLIRRKQAEDALRASEERFRRLSMASNDGVVIVRDGRFLEVNAAFSRMAGYPEGELPSNPVADYIAPADRDEVVRRMLNDIEGTYFASFTRRDGTVFEAEVTAKRCMYRGSPARIAVVRDITEWRRVDRLKNEFVSTVSHELRTPLTSIRGALGLLEGGVGGSMAPKALDLLRMARENSDRLIRLINELLDLDKIEAGKLELKYVTLTPAAIVRMTLDGIAGMADEHKIRLVEHVEAHRSFVADRDRIVQVLTNLLSNAIKFSPAGSAVEVEVHAISTMVRFAVHNDGPGIAAADRARLFARFQQLDSGDNRRRGGTGLGLAISKAIVEQHGGHIGVQSEPNVRTTFWFEIPMARVKRE